MKKVVEILLPAKIDNTIRDWIALSIAFAIAAYFV